jgi:uncharacterized membrane protein YtjA (UPF0391 family)
MLTWAIIFLLIALGAALFGFTGLYVAASTIAQALFFVFLVVFLLSLIVGLSRRTI